MYVIEHALLNIVKNRGRNMLFAVIVFSIIASTVVALSIYNTSGVFIEETRAALKCAARIVPQRQATGSGGAVTTGGGGAVTAGANARTATISIEQYLSFAESEYLDGADINESGIAGGSAGGVGAGIDAVYYLKRPDMLTAFEADLRAKGLPIDYAVKTDEQKFDSIAGPVESLKSISFAFLIIVLVLGAIIMVLISIIAVRERKYEIGVLRAMGMKRKKIALGLCAETIAITCLCFILGVCAGAALSQPISDAIMTGQAQSSETGSTSLADRLSGTDDRRPQKIDVTVSAATALEIFGVSILLASISGAISVSRITNSEPIKILMERN